MTMHIETLPAGNCLRLLPSQSPPDMTIHSAEGNCLRPTPGQSLPIEIYSKLPRYYPKKFHYKLPRYFPMRCGDPVHSDHLQDLERMQAEE